MIWLAYHLELLLHFLKVKSVALKIVMSGVASYKTPATLESEKKVTLLYGLNGSGKSTISNYLYEPGNPDYKHCSNQGFNTSNVLVYNTKFVRDNFFEIDKLNGIFTLSKVNKDVENNIKKLADELKNLNTEKIKVVEKENEIERSVNSLKSAAEEATWKIKTQYSGGDRVLEYCLEGLKTKSRLFEHISLISYLADHQPRTIEVIKKEVEILQDNNTKAYATIPSLTLEKNNLHNAPILGKIIVGKLDSPVADLIKKLDNADWVSQGIVYAQTLKHEGSDLCPFCQSPTLSELVAKTIEEYFDESFNNAIDSLKNLQILYLNFENSQPAIDQYLDNPFAKEKDKELKALYGQLIATIKSNLHLIQQKIKSPSIPINLESTDKLIEEINEIIKNINNDIGLHNERINDRKNSLSALRTEFWLRCRVDYDSTITGYSTSSAILLEDKRKATNEVTTIDAQLKSKTAELVNLQQQTVNVDAAINSINDRLQSLGIDSFKIIKVEDNRYRLSRNGDSADDFHTLSEGEKTVISFIYFVELCKGKRSPEDILEKKIAIIDDPISSLSHIYVFHIGQLIKDEFSNSELFTHIIVLTHSLYFFYELTDIKKERRDANQKLLRVVKNLSGSSIVDMKYEEVQNDYQAYWSVVMDKAQHPALIANCMRNIIEYFFSFVRKRELNNVFQIPALKEAKYQAFYRFMNRESHSLGQNILDYKEFDYEKFKEAFKLVFDETGFPEHYTAMSR